jgi:3-keto-disaccharide hydrolase
MRNVQLAVMLIVVVVLASATWAADANTLTAEERDAGFVQLFDGKTLTGWDGNPKLWSVVDGAIVGRTTPENPTKGNTFLIWRHGLLCDFELRLSWKIEGGNSGVQYRSRDYGKWVSGGYQADIDANHRYTGILYEERGRGIMVNRGEKVERGPGQSVVVEKVSSDAAVGEAVNRDGWNEYVITARGNTLTQTLNGVPTMVLIDNEKAKAASCGVLALQLHAGPPMTVRFRSIRLKRLTPEGGESLFDGQTLTGWKRHDALPGHGVAGKWVVEDGAIVGIQDPPGQGGFLTTFRTFKDFQFECETQVDWPFDSGIFLRVGPQGKSHQVTIDYRDGGDIGGIYCPWTQGSVHRSPEGIKHFKKGAWNHLKISCQGEPARIKVWVNGTQVTDFQHTAASTKGVPKEGTLCLQVHPGGEGYDQSKARFRNLRIGELPAGTR